MDNIESYIWLFCLDYPDTKITSEFLSLVITFSKSFYSYTPHIVVWMLSFVNKNHKLQVIGAETVSLIFCQILPISWQRPYFNATRALGDFTAITGHSWHAHSNPTAR